MWKGIKCGNPGLKRKVAGRCIKEVQKVFCLFIEGFQMHLTHIGQRGDGCRVQVFGDTRADASARL